MSKNSNLSEIDAWRVKKYQECMEASEHQMRVALMVFGSGDKKGYEAHKASASKYTKRANLLDTETFKTIAEGEAALEEIR